VLGEADHGAVRYRAVNSCIRLAHSIDGMALWTVEDIAGVGGRLHPAQEAMVQAHGSQCGFCTPGFVMSLFGMYNNHVSHGTPITRAMAVDELSGNLCRCTGYRPILDAAQAMGALPAALIDETALLSKLELLAQDLPELEADLAYKSPRTLPELLQLRAAQPQAQLVAGCTDVGLWVTKQHLQFERVIDVTQVRELRRVEDYPLHLAIGAAVPLVDAYAALSAHWPQLHAFATRFAGLPVRNSGTLGGNVANGSPIGDSMPLLIALGANVVLMSVRGHRELPLERLYTGYRQNVMAPDEVLAWIKVPKPGSRDSCTLREAKGSGSPHPHPLPEGEGVTAGGKESQAGLAHSRTRLALSPAGGGLRWGPPPLAPSPLWGEGGGEGLPATLQVYKISKRFDDDISAVCIAINLQIDNSVVTRASIGVGGVAATPVRAIKTEAALAGQPWTAATIQHAIATLRAEFSPISDMRASGNYRREVLGNLLQRYWLESQGLQPINLQAFALEDSE
jgi:xanthine dehydrogenase small subunit